MSSATTTDERAMPAVQGPGWVEGALARVLHSPADVRQLGIVGLYWITLFVPYFVPEARNIFVFLFASWLSFLNAVVIHNHLHKGVFRSKALNRAFRLVLSFGALYPASSNIASHNLVHHHFEDDGQPDWAAPEIVDFRWNKSDSARLIN